MAEVGYDTILEGDLPERSANYTSLETFAGKTQTDWENEIWGAEDTRWGGILSALWSGLESAGTWVVSVLQTLGNAIFEGVNFVFTTVSNALTAIADTFGSWWEAVTRSNTSSVLTSTTLLAEAVSGGVAVSDDFDGPEADDFGAEWTVVSDGAGAGFYGPSGSGRGSWKSSGALERRHVNVYDTPLASDYQLVSAVVGAITIPQVFDLEDESLPWVYLIGRCNSGGTEFVWARFNYYYVQLGYTTGGVYTQFSGAEVYRSGWSGGAELEFFIGTDDDEREFIFRANGVTQVSHTDSGDLSGLGASNRYVGLVASAVTSDSGTGQFKPPELAAWAASDRLAAATGS